MRPITENWLHLGLLPFRAAWLLPVCPSGSFLMAGVRASHRAGGKTAGIPRVSMDHDQASAWITGQETGQRGVWECSLGKKEAGVLEKYVGREGELWRPVRRRRMDGLWALSHRLLLCLAERWASAFCSLAPEHRAQLYEEPAGGLLWAQEQSKDRMQNPEPNPRALLVFDVHTLSSCPSSNFRNRVLRKTGSQKVAPRVT